MNFLFSYSPWYFLLCILIGVVLAYILYSKKNLFTKAQNWTLAILRAATIALIAAFLLNPLLKLLQNQYQKPIVVLAIDNSKSMASHKKEALESINKTIKSLDNKKVDIKIRDLNNIEVNLNSIEFNLPTTNYSNFYKNLNNEFEGQYLKEVILFSDGIVNEGFTTLNKEHIDVSTVSFGDTTLKKALKILNIAYNKTVQASSKTELKIDFKGLKLQGETALITIKDGQKLLASQTIKIDEYHSQSMLIEVGAALGTRLLRCSLSLKNGSYRTAKDLAIEVVDKKDKILILAASPHPDIKAIKSILTNYDIEIVYKGQKTPEIKPSLVIFHQLPSTITTNKYLSADLPKLFILGPQTDLLNFNKAQNVIKFNRSNTKLEEVKGKLSPKFSLFNIKDPGVLNKLTPVGTLNGQFNVNAGTQTLISQKTDTTKPIISLNAKEGVMLSDFLWRWRQEEFMLLENNEFTSQVFQKFISLLAKAENSNKLKIIPTKDQFSIDEPVSFEIYAVNDLNELIANNPIKLKLAEKTYDFSTNLSESTFITNKLAAGSHNYRGQATIQGKPYTISGNVLVTNNSAELTENVANWSLLRQISNENRGTSVSSSDIQVLLDSLHNKDYPKKVLSIEDYSSLLSLPWILGLLILFLTVEWFFRKYLGSY